MKPTTISLAVWMQYGTTRSPSRNISWPTYIGAAGSGIYLGKKVGGG